MSVKQVARFALGAALFSPFLATEDVLRYFGAPISKHGLTKNDEGKGMLEIWNECAPAETAKAEVKTSVVKHPDSMDFNQLPAGFVIPEGF